MELVTLITCIYNTKDTLVRYFDSVLAQDYARIQFILVNDGSTDNSCVVINEYREKFSNQFEEFIYLEKANGGCSSAINYALPYVKGAYLTVADGDDVLEKSNLSRKAMFLDNYSEYGIVVNQAVEIRENGEQHVLESRVEGDGYIFDRLINYDINCYAGAYMIRSKFLWEKLPQRSIYCRREVGAHIQLLAPVAYDHKCGVIEEVLYYRYLYAYSDCHRFSYEQEMNNLSLDDEYFRGVLSFLKDESEVDTLLFKQRQKAIKKMIEKAFLHNDSVWFDFAKGIDKKESLGLYKDYILQKEELMKSKKAVVLYGYGNVGKMFYSYWKDRIKFVVDNNIKGTFIFKYDDIKGKISENEDEVVIASVNYKDQIFSQIKGDYENIKIICL